jgi:phospholipid-binding lipoprotein MlaA
MALARIQTMRTLRAAALAALAALLGACATVPPNAGSNPADPFERYNRNMAEFNDRIDRAVFKPVAQAYADYVPTPARDCVGNIFSNIGDVPNALNNLLQGKPGQAVSDLCRVAVNTTVGLLGCFDVASKGGLPKSNEDFGQTLGRWGFGAGPYFVWPFLGPSTIRDSFGRVVDIYYTDPVDYVNDVGVRNTMYATRFVDARARLLPTEKLIEGAALDRYLFIRDAYLQRRRNLVYDGNPPRTPDEDEEDDTQKPATAPDQPQAPPAR